MPVRSSARHIEVIPPASLTVGLATETDSAFAITPIIAPTVTGTVDFDYVTLTWPSVSGNAGYKVYCDGALIKTLTTGSTTFYGQMPPGTFSFTVKTLFAGGVVSGASVAVSLSPTLVNGAKFYADPVIFPGTYSSNTRIWFLRFNGGSSIVNGITFRTTAAGYASTQDTQTAGYDFRVATQAQTVGHGGAIVVWSDTAATNDKFFVEFLTNGKIRVHYRDSGGTVHWFNGTTWTLSTVDTGVSYSNGTRYHVRIEYKNGDSNLKLTISANADYSTPLIDPATCTIAAASVKSGDGPIWMESDGTGTDYWSNCWYNYRTTPGAASSGTTGNDLLRIADTGLENGMKSATAWKLPNGKFIVGCMSAHYHADVPSGNYAIACILNSDGTVYRGWHHIASHADYSTLQPSFVGDASRVWAFYNKTVVSAAAPGTTERDDQFFRYTDDNGLSWTDEVQIYGDFYPRWQALTAYSTANPVTSFVRRSVDGVYVFECTTAGTSGASEPTWNTSVAGTTADGTVTWTCRNNSLGFRGKGLVIQDGTHAGRIIMPAGHNNGFVAPTKDRMTFFYCDPPNDGSLATHWHEAAGVFHNATSTGTEPTIAEIPDGTGRLFMEGRDNTNATGHPLYAYSDDANHFYATRTDFSQWAGTHAYAFGDVVRELAHTGDATYVYRCIVAGTSSGTEPTWTSLASWGDTVVDGTAKWQKVGACGFITGRNGPSVHDLATDWTNSRLIDFGQNAIDYVSYPLTRWETSTGLDTVLSKTYDTTDGTRIFSECTFIKPTGAPEFLAYVAWDTNGGSVPPSTPQSFGALRALFAPITFIAVGQAVETDTGRPIGAIVLGLLATVALSDGSVNPVSLSDSSATRLTIRDDVL